MRYNFRKADPELWNAIKAENKRQDNDIDLIPSENYVSNAVRTAMGSRLTNKYAEGMPSKRYYGGCSGVDKVENIARQRAIQLFHANGYYANVQPYSGTEANLIVYSVVLKPGDTILAMAPSDGGHISHGSKVSISGTLYHTVFYGVNKKGYINYDQVARLAKKYHPKLIICGASAYPRVINWKKFREIANSVHAYMLADIAHISGLIAGGVHPSPVGIADFVNTTIQKTLRGPRAGLILAKKQFGHKISTHLFRYQGGPHESTIAGMAEAFWEDMQPSFKTYAHQIVKNAKAMASVFNQDNKVSLLTGGTDNHLMILDLRHTGMDGDTLQNKLEKVHITTNKEMIPNDPLPPTKTSGLRVGTPAITTRGFKEKDCKEVAHMILTIIHHPNDKAVAKKVSQKAHKLTSTHPIED